MSQKIKSRQMDWGSFSNNIKRAKTTTPQALSNGTNHNLGGNGAQVTFTVSEACIAMVIVCVATRSTTDYETKPMIFLDGSVHSLSDVGAAVSGTASNRAIQRTLPNVVSLSAGAHTLAAGITVSSATSASVSAGEGEIIVLVLGRVTA